MQPYAVRPVRSLIAKESGRFFAVAGLRECFSYVAEPPSRNYIILLTHLLSSARRGCGSTMPINAHSNIWVVGSW